MTRTKRKHLLRALANETKSPLSPSEPDLLARNKFDDRQSLQGTCVVLSSSCSQSNGSNHDFPIQKAHESFHKSLSEVSNRPIRKNRVVSSSTTRAMSIQVPKPRNPPPKHASRHASKIVRAHRKLPGFEDVFFIIRSPSICLPPPKKVSPKKVKSPLAKPALKRKVRSLPILGKPTRQVVIASSMVPQFVYECHPFQPRPQTFIFAQLSEVIKTLFAMGNFRPCNKRNGNRLNGEMHMIGFRPGNDKGKSGGTYARKKLTPAQTAEDDRLWAKLRSFNDFLAGRMEAISSAAYQQNKELMQDYGIPNWSQDVWRELKKEDQIDKQFASNVSVTFNNFYNKPHQDKKDLNGWTYGIFSYIDNKTGEPIPPPSSELGHGFLFPQHAYVVDFVKSEGIIELVWQTTKFDHCTTPPPPSLRTMKGRTWTHFGCSFQINKNLANVAKNLKEASAQLILEKTLCKAQKYPPSS
ncbi:hypothetical protein PTTG_29216 [Puccinia triticina 1-1 BBBD Race 1]|uniref:Tet-like 2OG-Fe(II) oxygenase domain-containing protein n=1 Tax=Puccinia triticina (isolate 1-1 / race 1 (BBBD)) TaxID=630390 RepID=A0A180G5K0_PUCT1|nr:hypothetical protein PTTG_29216 [Puccinia triticina 1-1 BBBD Race 1]